MKKTSKTKDTVHKTKEGGTCVCASCPNEYASWGIAVLRVTVGVLFVLHGLQKFIAMAGSQGYFASIGILGWVAWPVALIELLGGLALILGFWTTWASYGLMTVMVGAFTFATFHWGAWSWLVVAVFALGCLGLGCGWDSLRPWWLVKLVLAVTLLGGVWLQVSKGINPGGATELSMVYLVALYALSMTGPGCYSLHDKCGCCE